MIMQGDRKRHVMAILGPEKKEVPVEDADSLLHTCAREAIEAVGANDVKGFLAAIKAIFEELDAEPHREGPHIDEE